MEIFIHVKAYFSLDISTIFIYISLILFKEYANVKKYTTSAKYVDNKEQWCVVDAEGAVLGRLASAIAARL